MHDFIEEVLLTNEEIVAIAERIGKQISHDYAGKKPLLIGLLKGSVPFLAELMKHIDIEMEVDFMKVSSYSGVHSTGAVTITKDTSTPLVDRDVIIVEDIIDTGRTLTYLKQHILEKKPNSLKIATLLSKPSRRIMELEVDYIGFQIEDKFVVGFGLDYDQKYRNF